MDIDLAVIALTAGVWLAAGIVADGLPQPRTVRALRRRATRLLVLTGAGLLVMAVPIIDALVTAESTVADRIARGLALPAVPAALVTLLTVRRLRRLRAAAGAFVAAPDTPAPPALTAGAAHPMIALPIQVTGLVALLTAVAASGLVPFTAPDRVGVVLTGAGLAVIAIGVRLALRHSRLAESAVSVRPASTRPTNALHV